MKYLKLFLSILLMSISTNSSSQSVKPTRTASVPVNGISMYYEEYGNGTIPLVLIHGGGSTIQTSFESIIPFLASSHKIIAVELQAHGRTSDRDKPESFTQDADDVAGLLKHLKINKANFFGFSNGGSTALQIAIRHPELVNKTVTLAAVTKRDGMMAGFFDFMPNATIDNMPEGLKKAFLKVNPDEEKLLNMFNKDKQRMLGFSDWPDEQLKSIKNPTLVIVSDRDVVTVDHTVRISKLIKDSRLLVLPGTHGECIGEIESQGKHGKLPEITSSLITDFLK